MNEIKPKVSIVGAGPGDIELLTIKGLKALQTADVVLYDALVAEEMLDYAPNDSLKVFVGKRAGHHAFQQEEINLMIVQYAFTHGHVVRLKGGDPFVFGRGHEELSFADSFPIETVIIPGISSCISVPELQKVPLTRRGVNESFWVLTATTKSGSLSSDIALAAQSTATAVILMGMRKISKIAAAFSYYGKENTPVLVIQNGSRDNERFVLGNVKNIAEKVKEEGLGAPGIIIIGEVVKLHPSLNFIKEKIDVKHEK